ncbi:MgtC/SapB family protein [Salipaludibacillus sp. CUR1]|uniref:MgtC/SapB family protein n=1 Tax=Salipaludibacillus sp. CUR1 TaxID=2820003 RepID=UPI001E61A6AD|nr:MgtC/SapB family protein [Salipaludibacillus sp. CUR1]MCE7793828.1 MgtC/SapB family protein [Salipaludibacillus sp. CUR1]
MEWAGIMDNELVIMATRLFVAALLGGLIGLEREISHHSAGFRTHMLVSVGSCLVMLLAFFGFQDYLAANTEVVRYDPSRLASYVISGIGFLGAGTILVQGYSIRGLTTAASIWVVAGIGLTVGAGMFGAAFLTTIIVILSLFFLGKVRFRKGEHALKKTLTIMAEEENSRLNEMVQILEANHISIHSMKTEKQNIYNENPMIEYRLLVEYKNENAINAVLDELHRLSFVKQVLIEKE